MLQSESRQPCVSFPAEEDPSRKGARTTSSAKGSGWEYMQIVEVGVENLILVGCCNALSWEFLMHFGCVPLAGSEPAAASTEGLRRLGDDVEHHEKESGVCRQAFFAGHSRHG